MAVLSKQTHIQLCGELTIELDGKRLEGALRGRQGRMLFAYLALNRDRPVRRDELIEALWANEGSPPGDAVLAPPLSRLRKTLGEGRLTGRGELKLVLGDDAWVDWEVAQRGMIEARDAAAAADFKRAWDLAEEPAAIAGRGLLPGLEAAWIDERRTELSDLRVEALELRARAGAQLGGSELALAEKAGRAAVEAAPFRESARVALIEILWAQGNTAEALRAYEEIRVLLREELGASPGAALLALHERLLNEESAPAPAAPVKQAPARRAVAAPVSSADIVDRDSELRELATAVDEGLGGQGRVVVIEGPAGIGKSRLLAEVRRQAADTEILSAKAGQLERDYPFGVVRQLFEQVAADPARRDIALSGAAGPAASVLGLGADQSEPAEGSFAIIHGMYWMALNLAAERPLVLMVDDLHWSDIPSLRMLAYLTRRLEGLPILFVATVRTGETPTDEALLGEIVLDPETRSVKPGALGEDAVADLVRDRLGPDADSAFCRACHETTRGNPLLLRQLLAALQSDAVTPDAAHADVVRAIGSRAISSAVLLRLSRLGPQARAVARAVAVLGEGADLRAIAAFAELDEREVAAASRELAKTEILSPEIDASRTRSLEFVHPLVRDAVYLDLSSAERQVEHARAADILADAGAGPEQIATQLLAVPPRGDDAVAKVLSDAANLAIRQGAMESAIAYIRRALDEPPAPERRPQLLLDLGIAQSNHYLPAAIEPLQEALDLAQDPVARAEVLQPLGRAMLFSARAAEGGALTEAAAAALGPEHKDLSDRLRAFSAASLLWGFRGVDAMSEIREFRESSAGDGPGARWLEAVAALDWAYTDGTSEQCVKRVHEVLADGQLILSDPGFLAIASLIVIILADAPESLQLWEGALAEAHSKGSAFAISGARSWVSFAMLRRGDLLDSYRIGQDTAFQFADYGYASEVYSYSSGFRAFTLVERGMYEEARAVLDEHGRPQTLADGTRFWRAGELELLLATGQDDELQRLADVYAEEYGDYYKNPSLGPWRSIKATSLHRTGRTPEGLELVESELVDARHWGAPGTLGRTLRTLGVLRGKDGIEALEEAVAILEGSTARLEHAKSIAALGSALSKTKKAQSRELLGRAYELARICGADPLAEEVADQLRKVDGASLIKAPSGVAALTRLERRVAELAADGSTDREIAQALYLTPAVITTQMAEAHRKLGVETREQFGPALAIA